MPRTPIGQSEGSRALKAWYDELPYGKKQLVHKQLKITRIGFRRWLVGEARPGTHLRMVLEIMTEGNVTTSMWLLPNERKMIAKARAI